MIIKLLTNTSEKNKIGKSLTELQATQGKLREESSMVDPVFTIACPASTIGKTNYIRVPDFGRYYFVTNIESVRDGLWRIHAHVDVLESYKDEIKAQTAVIARQESKFNLFMNDPLFKVYQNPKITTHKFPSGFTSQSFVMAVAGG